MNSLQVWLRRANSIERAELLEAVREKFPRFSNASITQYAHGDRIPDITIAQIISGVTGIPLSEIAYRYVHIPNDQIESQLPPE
jgi:hypothetical protein